MLLILWPTVQAAVYIEGPLTHEKIIEPGQSYSGTIKVRNSGKTMKEVKVFQRNYLFNAKGESHYLPLYNKKGAARSNAKWISFRPQILKVPPKSLASIRYVVRVPNSQSLKGTYWSVLMVQPISDSSPLSSKPKKRLEMKSKVLD